MLYKKKKFIRKKKYTERINENGRVIISRTPKIKRDPLRFPENAQIFADSKERKTVYNKKYHCRLIYRLALLNLSDNEMCVPLDIGLDDFHCWKRQHPEFKTALQAGRERADARVARALYRRAVGWGVLEKETIVRKVKDADGSERLATIEVMKRKQYPPDVQAAAMWLRNRQSAHWTTADAVVPQQISYNVDFSQLSLDELKMAQRLGLAAKMNDNVIDVSPITNNGNLLNE